MSHVNAKCQYSSGNIPRVSPNLKITESFLMFQIIIKTENLYIWEAMNVLVWKNTCWLFFCQTISAVLLVHLQQGATCFECKNLQF